MKGFLITILTDDELLLIEFFKLFRFWIGWRDDNIGKATSLIIGVWKIETNLTFAYRNELEWHDIGKA